MDKICIDNLTVYAKHGVLKEERELGQKFEVSAVLYTDTRKAGLKDTLDKSIDYILGTSDDDRSVKLTEADQSQLGAWQMEDDCRKIMRDYMSLDEFGKAAVENLIQMEKLRCMNQQTIITKSEDK